jgi:hypothetical protein
MLKFFMTALIAIVFSWPAQADTLSESDKSAFREIVTGQLEAFKADDGEAAYTYAAPIIKGIFPNSETFMAMVKRGYQPVYRNNGYKIGAVAPDSLGRPALHVTITATDGKRYEAVYSMERQPDGTWKIAGCTLVEIPGTNA